MGLGRTRRYGFEPDLGPSGQARTHENAAAFQVFSASVWLDDLSPDSFVGFDSTLRNGWSYAGRRGFFLLANARSRLRR
jgi:hypothetical protein